MTLQGEYWMSEGAPDRPVTGTKTMPARSFISTGAPKALSHPCGIREIVTQCKRCGKDIGPGGVCRCCSRLERVLRAIFGVEP